MAHKLDITYKEHDSEKETFNHLNPEIYGKSGIMRKPVLDGVYPNKRNGLQVTAVAENNRYEYDIDYTKPRGVARWWTVLGCLAMICRNKKKQKCKAKMHLKTTNLDYHNKDSPNYNDPEKFNINNYEVQEHPNSPAHTCVPKDIPNHHSDKKRYG